jgi:predicted nucleic acid-binding protein
VTWIVDASVAAKWMFEEEFTANARTLIESGRPLVAPDIIFAEVGNVAWKRVLRGEIAGQHARAAVNALPQLLSLTVESSELVYDALDLALKLKHPVYDCLYVALAERQDTPLVTGDSRLLERLTGAKWSGSAVALGDLPL